MCVRELAGILDRYPTWLALLAPMVHLLHGLLCHSLSDFQPAVDHFLAAKRLLQ